MDLLIVDDEASLRDFMTIVFEEDGWKVETAGSLAEGRAALQKNEPDLILCDLMLPDGSGLDLLRESKAQNPTIAVSAGKKNPQNFPACGRPASNADGWLSIGPKPFAF